MASIQFVRIDLGETPAEGSWTRWVEFAMMQHDASCEYPVCEGSRCGG